MPQIRPDAAPSLAPRPVPTLCDRCRAEGEAGTSPFEDLAGLLDFTPVPVKRHANNWTPEHQRAFIAALAITGNESAAARSIGRYATGATRLRNTARGKQFAEAWDNALDLYRERELAGLGASMTQLEADHRAAAAHRNDVYAAIDYHRTPEPSPHGAPDAEEVAQAYQNIADKLWRCRQDYLRSIADDPAARAAWETLCGPTDWAALDTPPHSGAPTPVPNMREAPWVVVTEAGEDEAEDDVACDHPASAIEAEQSRELNGGHPMQDYRNADAKELRERGFEGLPNGGPMIRQL